MDRHLKQSMFEYYQARVPEYDEVYQGKGPASISEPDAYTSEVKVLSVIVGRTCRGDVIDIACGTAFWLPNYVHNARHITLLDESPKMLDAARSRVESTPVRDRCNLVCGDILQQQLDSEPFDGAPFDGAPFDSALVGFLISHLTSKQEVLFFQILRSILKPKGEFLILDSVWTEARAKIRQKEGPQQRSLNDGREFQIYKKYFTEEDLLLVQSTHKIDLVTEHFGKAFFAARGSFRNG